MTSDLFIFAGQRYRPATRRAELIERACAHQKNVYAVNPAHKKNQRYIRKYGLTLVEFEALLASQQGRCGICGSPDPVSEHWHVDHDHNKRKGDPGFIRGVLCFDCNTGGGRFHDNPTLLRRAARWFSS